MKYHFRTFLKIALAVALLMPVASCVNYNKLKVTSVSVESVSPSGLRAANGTVKLSVENNSSEFTISDIEGVVYRSGSEIGTLNADNVTIRRGSADYNVAASVALGSNVSILELISIASNSKINDFTLNLSLKVKAKGGAAKKINLKDIPLGDVIKKLKIRGI